MTDSVADKHLNLEPSSYSGNTIGLKNFGMPVKLLVHRNQEIYTIEKFNYLRSKLTGAAQLVISGLSLSISKTMI